MSTPEPTAQEWEEAPWTALRQSWQHHAEKEREERKAWGCEEMEQAAKLCFNLHRKGWHDACYAPKDGTYFLGWDPGSTYPYVCRWLVPDGESWTRVGVDAFCDGDVWPARPTHWKKLPDGTPFYSEANERVKAARLGVEGRAYKNTKGNN